MAKSGEWGFYWVCARGMRGAVLMFSATRAKGVAHVAYVALGSQEEAGGAWLLLGF